MVSRVCALMLLVFGLVAKARGDIYTCPAGDECLACDNTTEWVCVTIPPGHHDPSLNDNYELFATGYKGYQLGMDFLEYRVVFHNNTLTYPSEGFETNVNKLFGFSRGSTPVMSRSCIFGWRASLPSLGEPEGFITTYAYGWRDRNSPPWTTDGQMPFMLYAQVQREYIFTLDGTAKDQCTYTVTDSTSGEKWIATTPEKRPRPGPSYYFSLYFGGSSTTTEPVTVSYSKTS
mmetsp:Transcript_25948/g.72657  ORF Transcript_25948/g.72657 Transcript_25948/m.72657 type:complete len:232 (-) Transcript_25948:78-773(-)|eukprot:CAMPEP_0119133580 /NCGR_PEP_ID=MMETSP1310-20130426/13446_1 /TAXON_ID=464262 /ORGANISM="Genus nov. species nov., Strain RCC2339" /LENGTH=231 /DNA_ID=CAMNT_0007124277 /DNA_START=34 /DNA_END=729 /DNA_ORIENTATION=-